MPPVVGSIICTGAADGPFTKFVNTFQSASTKVFLNSMVFSEKGGACQAFSHHGYVGVEREVVLAMRSWAKTGTVPPDVGR